MPLLTTGAGRYAAAAAPAWLPTDLPNLIGWWTAAGSATSGGNVTQSNDLSGGANHLTPTGGNVPYSATAFNGFPAFNFVTANNAALIRASFPMGTGTAVSVIIAGQMGASTASFGGAVVYGLSGSNDYQAAGAAALITRDSGNAAINSTRESYQAALDMTTGTNEIFAVVHAVPSGGLSAMTLRVEGANDPSPATTLTLTPFTSAGTLVIGNRWLSGAVATNGWDGPMAEIIICNGELNEANLLLAEAYLTPKYGL